MTPGATVRAREGRPGAADQVRVEEERGRSGAPIDRAEARRGVDEGR